MTQAPSPTARRFDLVGIGNPIMDLLAHVDDGFLAANVAGEKGGMVLVDDAEIDRLLGKIGTRFSMVSGGSAANAVLGATRLGLRTSFIGKIGGDETADNYFKNFTAAGGDGSRFKRAALPNGRCLSMVTPDGQRTMRTHLGAAMTLDPNEITVADFDGARHAHIEGYLLFNPALAEKVASTARAAGCSLSLELSSFEVVRVAREWILEQLHAGMEVIFANEDEVRALFETEESYESLARKLASFGGTACVKLGKDGALVARGDDLHRIAPVVVPSVVDTTGAGDAWAAGFLYGYLKGWPLPACGALGSELGAATVGQVGPALPEDEWERIRALLPGLAAS